MSTQIYTGPWINWSNGRILGATLTLSARPGGLLSAFLAIYITLAGTCFWAILRYALHQVQASQGSKDALHRQQQAVFRNTSGAATAAWEFLRLGWCWRSVADKPFWRCLPFVLAAVFNLSLFAVASVLSSEITKVPGNETLIHSSSCGIWTYTQYPGVYDHNLAQLGKNINDTLAAAAYARACYQDGSNIMECSRYTAKQIQWNVNINASCPFDPGRCLMGDNAAYEMDTGPIDSHHVLGINAPEKDRVTYRNKVVCAPLNSTDVVRLENSTSDESQVHDESYLRFYYGPYGELSNWTYEYNTILNATMFNYEIFTFSATASRPWIWNPSSELNRTDADVSLFFMTPNAVQYLKPVDDPWFSAHKLQSSRDGNTTWWRSDHLVNVLGCTNQHIFCSSLDPSLCIGLGGAIQTGYFNLLGPLDAFTPGQIATMYRLGHNLMFLNIDHAVMWHRTDILKAQTEIYGKYQLPLPNNQWQVEVSNWMAVSMAKLQQLVVEFATGPQFLPEGVEIILSDEMKPMCDAQKVRHSGGYMSFSIFGMAIILVVGGLMIFLSLVTDILVGWCQQRLGRGMYRRLQWISDEKLQMQRMTYEAAGIGHWSGATESVPLTQPGELFSVPQDMSELRPRICKCSESSMASGI